MVVIRLTRRGAKKKPFYRIVAADSRMPRDGRFLEILGTYDPMLEENSCKIAAEKLIYSFELTLVTLSSSSTCIQISE